MMDELAKLKEENDQLKREIYAARSILHDVWETTDPKLGDPNAWGYVSGRLEAFLKSASYVNDDTHVKELKNVIRSYTDMLRVMAKWCEVVGYPSLEFSKGIIMTDILEDLDYRLKQIESDY